MPASPEFAAASYLNNLKHENRVRLLKEVLPQGQTIYEKSHKATPSIAETWEAARTLLNEGKQAAIAQLNAAQAMHPHLLLRNIDERLSGFEYALDKFTAAAVQMQEKSQKNAMETIVQVAAVARKETEAFTEPGAPGQESTFEHKIAEESIVEEGVPQQVVHSAESILRLKETAAQTKLTANASRPQAEANDVIKKKETT